MAIDEDLAYKLAVKLGLIADCPRGEGVTESLALELIRLCPDETEARAVVDQACQTWERWHGIRGLIDIVESHRPAPPPSNQAIDYGPKPKVNCRECGDWGYFGAGGAVVWCDCPAGLDTRAQYPDLVSSLNRKQVKPAREIASAPGRAPITQADIDQAFADRQDRTEELIAESRAKLEDPGASRDAKEMAREILKRFGA